MTRRLGFILLALTLIATACGAATSGDSVATSQGAADDSNAVSPADTGSTEGGEEGTGEEVNTDTVAAGGTPMAVSSPLGQFFDGGFDEALAEYTTRVEESIVLCMAAQGFEFAVSGNGRVNEVEQRQNELTRREWTIEFGFGISTSFDSVAQGQATDPNDEIFFSMSPSEREIWQQTLVGGDIGDATGGNFGSRPLEEQGCIGQALIETGGQEAIEGLESFGSVYEEGEAALFDTREMVDAVDGWSRCMSVAGYPAFSELDDPEDDIAERLEVVTAPLSAAIDGLSEEEGQSLVAGDSFDVEDLPGLDIQALRDLQTEERAVALADLDCYEAEVQMIFEPLRDEFENGLLVDFATELGALRNIGS